ncbi:MAG: glycerate kinase [Actinobacteria bacterium]|nr:glycerate kinase [Actinomycetota bacterium]
MKIIVACDKYKGNLSAFEVCNTIKNAILKVDGSIEVVINPMADGGEGTVETLVESFNGSFVNVKVKGPLNEDINARFGIINIDTAVIEMASASGLWLVPENKRNPLKTTTYGTGQLIKKALELGCTKIIIGIGGSATNDAGMGMAQALGVKFYDKENNILGYGGEQLLKINRADISGICPLIKKAKISAACDVDNPLFGPKGAAYVYSPQKGADKEMVRILDRGLKNFSKVVSKTLGRDIGSIKGTGAAGGLGAGLVAFLGAELKRGADIIIEATSLEKKIIDADLVIAGEGVMDIQTFYGKSSYGVAKLAKKYGIPVITINGAVDISHEKIDPKSINLFDGNFATVNKILTLEEALRNGKKSLENITQELMRFYLSTITRYRKRIKV